MKRKLSMPWFEKAKAYAMSGLILATTPLIMSVAAVGYMGLQIYEKFNKRKKYEYYDKVDSSLSFRGFYSWLINKPFNFNDYSYKIPRGKPNIPFINKNKEEDTITWIGHGTFLIQKSGLNIVTDPIWSKFMFSGEHRITSPGIHIKKMPPIDVVLVSHNHQDHLDFNSLKKLKGNPLILVPKGDAELLKRHGFKNVKELDWWEAQTVNVNSNGKNVEFHFVPAQHVSGRGLLDANESHWGSWVIKNQNPSKKEKTIYFGGDTGYFSGFKEIGKRFKIDYALMPIGSYSPKWYRFSEHLSPEEAVKAYEDLHADKFIPMHYGTYRLGNDTTKESVERLKKGWEDEKLKENDLLMAKPGQVIKVSRKLALSDNETTITNSKSFLEKLSMPRKSSGLDRGL